MTDPRSPDTWPTGPEEAAWIRRTADDADWSRDHARADMLRAWADRIETQDRVVPF